MNVHSQCFFYSSIFSLNYSHVQTVLATDARLDSNERKFEYLSFETNLGSVARNENNSKRNIPDKNSVDLKCSFYFKSLLWPNLST